MGAGWDKRSENRGATKRAGCPLWKADTFEFDVSLGDWKRREEGSAGTAGGGGGGGGGGVRFLRANH